MLGKLLKHEWKATSRQMLPLYLGVLFITLATVLVYSMPQVTATGLKIAIQILIILLTIAFVLCIAALMILTVFFCVQRFYKHMLTDEGYLTLTLPVSPAAHQVTKLTVSTVWIGLSVGLLLLSIYAVARAAFGAEKIRLVLDGMLQDMNGAGIPVGGAVALFGLMMLSSVIFSLCSIYLSMALGQVFSSKHKIAAAVLAYFVIYSIMQIVFVIFIVIVAGACGKEIFAASSKLEPFVVSLMIGMSALYLVMGAGMFFMTNRIFTRKLNLE